VDESFVLDPHSCREAGNFLIPKVSGKSVFSPIDLSRAGAFYSLRDDFVSLSAGF
jgi:hypothetical protein